MARILVVDDTDYFRKSVVTILKGNEYEVFEAENGTDASRQLNEQKFDLVILDVVMPEKGGIETLQELQEKGAAPKIIIVTGKVNSGSDAFINLAQLYGASTVLFKPFKKQELLESVSKALVA